jgi:hypothetical protein
VPEQEATSVRQRGAEPRNGERAHKDPALERVRLRAADVPADESSHEADQRELGVQAAVVPVVEARAERGAWPVKNAVASRCR